MGVLLDSQLAFRPGGKGDALLEVFDLEPVFNVNGYEDVMGHESSHGIAQRAKRMAKKDLVDLAV